MSEFKPSNPNRSDNTLLIAGLLGGGFIVCICAGVLGFGVLGGISAYFGSRSGSFVPTSAPYWYPTEPPYGMATPNFTPPAPEVVEGVIEALESADIPERDRLDLAERFRGVEDAEAEQHDEYAVGDTEEFWVDVSGDQALRVQAILVYKTEVVYMWVEVGSDYDLNDIERSADRFTEETYPTSRAIFGEEANPGIDGDPRLHILHTAVMQMGTLGLYYSPSEYPAEAVTYSNEKEIFYISTALDPGTDSYDSVLAHEFQHMIHWNVDGNEESWLNEGLSEVASTLNGFGPSGFIQPYFSQTDTQLTGWTSGSGANYGGAYLFGMYFYDQFGEDALKTLIAHDENGLTSVEQTLAEIGEDISADDLFINWTIANTLNDVGIDPRYGYSTLTTLPPPYEAETLFGYPHGQTGMTVAQYGVDYIRLEDRADVTITFNGSAQVSILPTNTQSSSPAMNDDDAFVWWSNNADGSDTMLTREVDLSGVQAATLEYDLWYSIEEHYDYGYIAVSTDGERWTTLETSHTTTLDPHGNSYGAGYTGDSYLEFDTNPSGWMHESIDLSDYAGQEIFIRFEYITDDAVVNAGMAVDNICIAAINWCDDAEEADSAWEARGWVRHSNVLPQAWSVQVISYDANGDVQVEIVDLDEFNHGEIDVIANFDQPAMLVISGLTRYTTQPAVYSYEVNP